MGVEHRTPRAVCSFCNWTNTTLLNIGEVNADPIWICHGCTKRQFERVKNMEFAGNPLRDLLRNIHREIGHDGGIAHALHEWDIAAAGHNKKEVQP